MSEQKTVLVTGGAGFIGSFLCEALLKAGNRVICVDNFSTGHVRNIEGLLRSPDFQFLRLDITEPFNLESFPELEQFKVKFLGVQEIYHLAMPTISKGFEQYRVQTLLANSVGTQHVLEVAVKYGSKVVFTSSAVVYGSKTAEKSAFDERDIGLVDHLALRAPYNEGKRFAETCVDTYRQIYGIDAKIARVFTTYGPRMKLFEGQLIPDFIINALDGKDLVIYGDETMSTSLLYVNDMVDGFVRLMGAAPEVKIINLGGDRVIKYTEVANKIIELTNSTSKIIFEKPLVFLTKKSLPDLTYAKDALGWMPLIRLEDGLQKAIDYTVANKEALLFQSK